MLMTVTLIGQWEVFPPVRSGERAADLGALTESKALVFFPVFSSGVTFSLLRPAAPTISFTPPPPFPTTTMVNVPSWRATVKMPRQPCGTWINTSAPCPPASPRPSRHRGKFFCGYLEYFLHVGGDVPVTLWRFFSPQGVTFPECSTCGCLA